VGSNKETSDQEYPTITEEEELRKAPVPTKRTISVSWDARRLKLLYQDMETLGIPYVSEYFRRLFDLYRDEMMSPYKIRPEGITPIPPVVRARMSRKRKKKND